MTSLLVVSPHLDDAVFGCGALLAAHPGSIVVTVFAGIPEGGSAIATEWDAVCGFSDARQAMRERRDEDRRALAMLGATPIWLDQLDGQYLEARPEDGNVPRLPPASAAGSGSDALLVRALRDAIAFGDSRTLLFPLGLFHADHVRVRRACLAALGADAIASAMAYEDAIYRAMPGSVKSGFEALAEAGYEPAGPVLLTPASARKAAAVQGYASQLRGFGPEALADLYRPERIWRLARKAAAPA